MHTVILVQNIRGLVSPPDASLELETSDANRGRRVAGTLPIGHHLLRRHGYALTRSSPFILTLSAGEAFAAHGSSAISVKVVQSWRPPERRPCALTCLVRRGRNVLSDAEQRQLGDVGGVRRGLVA